MGVEIKWNDDGLKKLQKNADAISGEHSVKLADLLTDSFLRSHSHFHALQELLDASGVKDAEEIGNERFSAFIQANTSFASWDDMMEAAGGEYVKRKLGFQFFSHCYHGFQHKRDSLLSTSIMNSLYPYYHHVSVNFRTDILNKLNIDMTGK